MLAAHRHAGKTVAEILAGKKATIKDAELEEDSPAWDEIMDVLWEEIASRAKKRLPGYQTIKKLLGNKEYDK